MQLPGLPRYQISPCSGAGLNIRHMNLKLLTPSHATSHARVVSNTTTFYKSLALTLLITPPLLLSSSLFSSRKLFKNIEEDMQVLYLLPSPDRCSTSPELVPLVP